MQPWLTYDAAKPFLKATKVRDSCSKAKRATSAPCDSRGCEHTNRRAPSVGLELSERKTSSARPSSTSTVRSTALTTACATASNSTAASHEAKGIHVSAACFHAHKAASQCERCDRRKWRPGWMRRRCCPC